MIILFYRKENIVKRP